MSVGESAASSAHMLSARERRRVGVATVIGTTIEWYDFFIYATSAGLIFQSLFFKPAGSQLSLLISFATVGISFLFRPLGAVLTGHLGDKIGRKLMLVLTLLCMGLATTLIGVLPTYATAGLAAPVLLIVLRIFQGLSAGGEWGGAVLMSVEHAPADKRGRYGMWPQLGVPIGILLASGVLALMTGVISPGAAFTSWGWRVPFLVSFVLIVVGYIVRRSVNESPIFTEIEKKKKQNKVPLVELFRTHWKYVILAALVFAGNNAVGYMTTGGYVQSYATRPKSEGGVLGMDETSVLLAVSGSAITWLIFTLISGYMADLIGRRTTYIIGWIAQLAVVFPLFWLVNTGSVGWLFLGLVLLTIGLVASLLLRDRPGIPLDVEFETSGQFDSWESGPQKSATASESATSPSLVS